MSQREVIKFAMVHSVTAMPTFGPEPGFELRTAEPNLRFRSSSVPVLLSDHMFGSRFQEVNNFEDLVQTCSNLFEPGTNMHIYSRISNKFWATDAELLQ